MCSTINRELQGISTGDLRRLLGKSGLDMYEVLLSD